MDNIRESQLCVLRWLQHRELELERTCDDKEVAAAMDWPEKEAKVVLWILRKRGEISSRHDALRGELSGIRITGAGHLRLDPPTGALHIDMRNATIRGQVLANQQGSQTVNQEKNWRLRFDGFWSFLGRLLR